MDTEHQYIDDGYFIIQNAHLIDKAMTYEEAIKKSKALKRSTPQSKVEVIFDGITAELRVTALVVNIRPLRAPSCSSADTP